MSAIQWNDDEIWVKTGKKHDTKVASFEATYGGDLIEGAIDETYETRMSADALIRIAIWLLEKAQERKINEEL